MSHRSPLVTVQWRDLRSESSAGSGDPRITESESGAGSGDPRTTRVGSFLAVVDRVFAGFADDIQSPIDGMLKVGGKSGKQGRRRRFASTRPRVAAVLNTVAKAVEVIEPRIVLSGTALVDAVRTYPVDVQIGQFGDPRVFGDMLYVLGSGGSQDEPIFLSINMSSGVVQNRAFSGNGILIGAYEQNGGVIFIGWRNFTNGSSIVYWDASGQDKVVVDYTVDIFDVSSDGTVVGTRGYFVGLTYKNESNQGPMLY